MSESNRNTNLESNLHSVASLDDNNTLNNNEDNIKKNQNYLKELIINQSKSPKKHKKRKKKKKNRHIKIICKNENNKKSSSQIEISKRNKSEENYSKLDIAELVQKKKKFSEKVKLIKLIKRSESVSKLENNSSLDLIKNYSKKVLNANRVNFSSHRNKEKEHEKQMQELLRIQIEEIMSSNTPLFKSQKKIKLPSLTKKKEMTKNRTQIRLITDANNNENSNDSSAFSPFRKHKKHKKNKRYLPEIQRLNNSSSEISVNQKDSIRKKEKEKNKERLKDFHRFYYLILPGNASYLVKNCMCHRTKWKEQQKYINYYNFMWREISYGINYNDNDKLSKIKIVVNHYENHSAISNKANMFINLMYYCEKRKISVFKYVPFTIIFELKYDKKNQDIYELQIEKLKKFIENTQNYVVKYEKIGNYFYEQKYKDESKKRTDFYIDEYSNRKKRHKKKYYYYNSDDENDDENKYKGEYLTYRDYFKRMKLFDIITTVYNFNLDSFEKEKVMKKGMKTSLGVNTVIEIPDTHYCGRNMWVVKAINLNRGMCIQIVNNFKQMLAVINKFKEGVDYDFTEEVIEEKKSEVSSMTNEDSNNKEKNNNSKNNENSKDKDNGINKDNHGDDKEKDKKDKGPMYYCSKIIIQKYIENPLLYKGRKCDMRIWVLLTHSMNVYFFKEGHFKTCSVTYDMNSKDAFSHITNYSFQKYNDNFQKFEKGNEVPFYEFQKFLDENYSEKNYKLNKDLINQIKEIVSITMKCAKDQINKNNRRFQFEIFGYDFMLDANFNLFLIEINTNPGIEESSPWIKIIVPRMLDDALRLTLDQIFYPEYDFSKIYKSEENENNMKMVLNNLKNKRDPNAPNSSTEDVSKSEEGTYASQNLGDDDKENKKDENKIDNKKKDKSYQSPFPVPGYEDDENLWEFVCDLNDYDPLDEYLYKERKANNDSKESFTGIKYLYNKSRNKKECNNEKTNDDNIQNSNKS